MTRPNLKRRATSVATKSRKKSEQTAPTRTSARKAACEAKESSKNKDLDCKDDFSDINDESSQSEDDSDNGRRRATSVATKSRKRSEPKMVRCCSGDQCFMPDTPLNSFHKCKECKKIMHGTLCSSVDNEDGNMWCMNCDPGKPAAATNAAAPKATAPKATRKARTSSRKLACVSKESSKNKSIDTTDDDESCESDDDSDNLNNSSNVEDEDRETLPPKSVNVNETTVSSVTKEPQVVHQKYDYNRQPSYYGSVVVDLRTDQRIREDLRKYLRKYWYQGKKFIVNDEQSRDLIEDSIRTKLVVKPNEWSYEQFYDKYQNQMKTALSAIRSNGQLLARKNYLSKNAKKTLSRRRISNSLRLALGD